jgi:uncharacterized protein YjbI with pentapeptide repeats
MTKRSTILITASLATLLTAFLPLPVARADIFQWEYINPANPALGKQPSTTLAPDGAGANAVPGTNLSNRNLMMAYLIGANLGPVDDLGNYYVSDLTGANLSQADLTNASVWYATLTGANLTGAEVRGANFTSAYVYDNYLGGITPAQLYSTASYQAHDLTGIGLYGNDLAGVNLAGQNLTNAGFYGATLTNANFSQANLTSADFLYAILTNANLSQANLTYARFSIETGSAHSTAGANLTGANLSQANLSNAYFAGEDWCGENGCGTSPGADLTNANLSGADARGANFYAATLTGANTSNLIQSNGHIAGLDLSAGASLVVRDYENYAGVGIPIVVEQHLTMDATGTLRLVLDADPWDSTISFSPGISIVRNGTLELAFAPGVSLNSQLGRRIDLFDWTGVTPTGAFTVSSPYTWNLSKLYTTGEVTLVAAPFIPGDFNGDGSVDAADYIVWRKTHGTPAGYNAWRTHFGQPPGSGATGGVPSGSSASPNVVPETASRELCVSSFWAISTFALRKPWRDRRHSPRHARHIL